MAEAGYPDGFKTSFESTQGEWFGDKDLTQVVVSYWNRIDIEVDVNLFEETAFVARFQKNESALLRGTTFSKFNGGLAHACWIFQGSHSVANLKDKAYEELCSAGAGQPFLDHVPGATTVEAMKKAVTASNRYSVERFWHTQTPVRPVFTVYQPWLVGYNGERQLGFVDVYSLFSMVWVNQDLK